MRRLLLLLALAAVSIAAGAQGIIHGTGDPRTLVPTPNCGTSRFYVDDSTGTMYQANQGSPCVWTPSSSAASVNTRDYGAKGDGVTNDCAAVSSAYASLVAAGGGLLSFPQGNYFVGSACHITLSVPTTVTGTGIDDYLAAGTGPSLFQSQITSTDPTGTLFLVTSNVAAFKDIAIVNTAGSAPSAGHAIFVNGADAGQRVDYDHIFVWGFYNNVRVDVGTYWTMTRSLIGNPVNNGLMIANVLNNDFGDWSVIGNTFTSGPRTVNNVGAGIAQTSSGGGKIIGNKFNYTTAGHQWAYGYYGNLSGSVQLNLTANDIENVSNMAIYIPSPYDDTVIANNYVKAASGGYSIEVGGSGKTIRNLAITGNVIHGGGVYPGIYLLGTVNSGSISGNANYNTVGFPIQYDAAGTFTNIQDTSTTTAGPAISAGTGAGTSPTVSVTGTSRSGHITVTTGTTPAASATVGTVCFTPSCFKVYLPFAPVVSLQPTNAAAVALTGTGVVFPGTIDQGQFLLKSGAAALAASTTYTWDYTAIY